MINRKKKINIRVIFLYILVLFVSIGVVVKIFAIQHFKKEINTNSQPRYFSVQAPRGNIIADDGSLLAISMPLYNIRLDMSVMDQNIFNKEIDTLSLLLAHLFKDKNKHEYKNFLIYFNRLLIF